MTAGLKTTVRFGVFSVVMVCAVAQTLSNSNAPAIAIRQGQFGAASRTTGAFFSGGAPFQPITDRPYSAEQVMERVQTLADGTHITQTTQKTMLYRDSAGRTRTEHTFMPPPGAAMASIPALIEIADPVAGCRYILEQQNRVARRTPWPPALRRVAPVGVASQSNGIVFSTNGQPAKILPAPATSGPTDARPHPQMSRESLGTQNIEGIPADGTRMTTTYPEGFFGNDRPITAVSETWFSPELKMVVLSKISDPRTGESTTKLINISQTEPDPSLFQVPPDYSLVDEQPPVIQR